MDYWPIIVQASIGGAVSGVAFWATVRVELRWLRRDVDFLLKNSIIRRERDEPKP